MLRQSYALRFTFYSLRLIFCAFVLINILTACKPADNGLQAAPFLPPTAALLPVETPSPAAAAETEISRPTVVPACSAGLTYLDDLTIPDGTLVSAGETLDKRWQVRNSGTCNWDERYRLKLIAGTAMGAPEEHALYPARSGVETTIRIVFTAPAEAGTYRSAWQAYDPAGLPFGDAVFIEVVVP